MQHNIEKSKKKQERHKLPTFRGKCKERYESTFCTLSFAHGIMRLSEHNVGRENIEGKNKAEKVILQNTG